MSILDGTNHDQHADYDPTRTPDWKLDLGTIIRNAGAYRAKLPPPKESTGYIVLTPGTGKLEWYLNPEAHLFPDGTYAVNCDSAVMMSAGGAWAFLDDVDSQFLPRPRLSGGEIPAAQAERFAAVRRLMQSQDDVHRVLDLKPIEDGRYLYLIATPFATFPKFVIGTTDEALEDVRHLFKCGAEWNAYAKWEAFCLNPNLNLEGQLE